MAFFQCHMPTMDDHEAHASALGSKASSVKLATSDRTTGITSGSNATVSSPKIKEVDQEKDQTPDAESRSSSQGKPSEGNLFNELKQAVRRSFTFSSNTDEAQSSDSDDETQAPDVLPSSSNLQRKHNLSKKVAVGPNEIRYASASDLLRASYDRESFAHTARTKGRQRADSGLDRPQTLPRRTPPASSSATKSNSNNEILDQKSTNSKHPKKVRSVSAGTITRADAPTPRSASWSGLPAKSNADQASTLAGAFGPRRNSSPCLANLDGASQSSCVGPAPVRSRTGSVSSRTLKPHFATPAPAGNFQRKVKERHAVDQRKQVRRNLTHLTRDDTTDVHNVESREEHASFDSRTPSPKSTPFDMQTAPFTSFFPSATLVQPPPATLTNTTSTLLKRWTSASIVSSRPNRPWSWCKRWTCCRCLGETIVEQGVCSKFICGHTMCGKPDGCVVCPPGRVSWKSESDREATAESQNDNSYDCGQRVKIESDVGGVFFAQTGQQDGHLSRIPRVVVTAAVETGDKVRNELAGKDMIGWAA